MSDLHEMADNLARGQEMTHVIGEKPMTAKEAPHPGYPTLMKIPLDELTTVSGDFEALRKNTIGWGAMGIGLSKEYIAIIDYALHRLYNSRVAMEPQVRRPTERQDAT